MGKSVLGEFEHHVLLATLRLATRAYTAAIVEELESVTGREVAPAAVYIALRRLEDSGLTESDLRVADGTASSRPRRYFRPTPLGMEMMSASRMRFRALWDGIEPLLRGES